MGLHGHFGPAVIGAEKFEEEKKLLEEQRDKYGPLVTGKNPDGTPYVPPKPAGIVARKANEFIPMPAGVKAAPAASIEELQKVLKENPAAFDPLFAAEYERAEGPRKGALDVFRKTEAAAPTPRPEVLARIKGSLEE